MHILKAMIVNQDIFDAHTHVRDSARGHIACTSLTH